MNQKKNKNVLNGTKKVKTKIKKQTVMGDQGEIRDRRQKN